MTLVSATELQSARRILTRLRFEGLKSKVLTHVLAIAENGAITLAVTDGVHWLESLFRCIEWLEDLPQPLAIPVVGDRETHPAAGFHAVNWNRRGTVAEPNFTTATGPGFFLLPQRAGLELAGRAEAAFVTNLSPPEFMNRVGCQFGPLFQRPTH